MSNTTNHQSTSELFSKLFGLPNNHTDARQIDRLYLRTKILKTERRLLGEDVTYERYYIDPERKYRGEREIRIIDEALDEYLSHNISPQISCTDQKWAKEVIDNLKKQKLYWSLWHAASCAAREIVEDEHIGYCPAIKEAIKTISEDPTDMDNRIGQGLSDLTEIVKQKVKADLKFVKQLTPSISINGRDMTNSIRMELEDYVIWAGCAYLLSLEAILKLFYYLKHKLYELLYGLYMDNFY